MKSNGNRELNTFFGNEAIFDYLNPENSPPTPLVELPEKFNKYKKDGVRIFAKLMNNLPLGNVKSLPALNMLLEEKTSGRLRDKDTVIENSSGNTVFSLSVIGKHLGIKNTKAVVSNEVSPGKLHLLRFLDTEIIVNKEPICPDPKDKESGIYKAKVWAKENNWFNPGQYDNEANPDAHYKWTGPQIWQQLGGNINVLVSTLGTTGTIYGLGKFFKEKDERIKVVGIARALNNPIPGPRTQSLLKEIAFDWKSVVDVIFDGDTKNSYHLSMELSRYGLMVGPSSGLALLGVYRYLDTLTEEERRNMSIVFICPDSPMPYVDEYFEVLGEESFPKIENEDLLLNRKELKISNQNGSKQVNEITTQNLYAELFNQSNSEYNNKILILDVRSEVDFFDHHIQQAVNVPLKELEEYITENKDVLSNYKKIFCVCKFGVSSIKAAGILGQNNLEAISLVGGMAKWSEEDLPRVKPKGCIVK